MNPYAGPSSNAFAPQGLQEYGGSLPPLDTNSGIVNGNPEWRYEMRREAQLIIPNLYLGPFQASLNAAKMKAMGITHVLCIRDRREERLIYPRFPQEFQYMTLDISDNPDQNLITLFPRCRDFIETALLSGGTVLAHCNGGIALSPAIVIGYLMWKYNWTAEVALAHVQNKRYCVSTMSFQNQFKEYEPIFMAQKMVQLAAKRENGSSKRQVEELDDEADGYRRKHRAAPEEGLDVSMDD
ncbi:hypothetical protein I350_03694 [Cryptococcus amylolentus CBS 6273]|uniref:Uncharacterized protein n=1 Tax=Cryptococcus amylolentus CBS 6273 TaxID=1296118 RepID=A0A1E3K4M9_9TREE|nr:hypothetical protein I350_03694 [Cryptococcus amylolentus CBS 6273]